MLLTVVRSVQVSIDLGWSPSVDGLSTYSSDILRLLSIYSKQVVWAGLSFILPTSDSQHLFSTGE
jgi:hypothetical protein